MSDLYPQIAHSLKAIYASFKRINVLIDRSNNNAILKEFTKYWKKLKRQASPGFLDKKKLLNINFHSKVKIISGNVLKNNWC